MWKFKFYVFWGGGVENHAVLLLNVVKHLSNWAVIGSSGCIVTTVQQSIIIMLSLGAASECDKFICKNMQKFYTDLVSISSTFQRLRMFCNTVKHLGRTAQ